MKKPQIHSLTSIRFFAAAMIVVLHSQSRMYGLPEDFLGGFPLDEGVALFFVLSGFIMTYVYPDLSAPGARSRFIVARFARMMPLHLTMLVVTLLVLPYDMIFEWDAEFPKNALILLTNALMVQAWVPFMDFYWSANAVSWSVSTELFFYLAFTLLVINIRNSWHWKLLAVFMIWLLIFMACRFLDLPGYSKGDTGITTVGLLYINPIARLPEFVTGMAVGVYFNRLVEQDRLKDLGSGIATVLEIACIFMCALAMWMSIVYKEFAGKELTHLVRLWIGNGGVCFFWAALVLIFATGRGHISQALSRPVFVRLGDISFAMYMCHEVINKFYISQQWRHVDMSGWIQYPIYWIVLMLLSYALWAGVENPVRRRITRWYDARRARKAAPESV